MTMHNANNPPPFPIPAGARLAPSDKGELHLSARDYLRASSVRSAPPPVPESAAQPRSHSELTAKLVSTCRMSVLDAQQTASRMMRDAATRPRRGILDVPLNEIGRRP